MSVRFGVLGAGWVATDRHIPGLARIEGASIVAVQDSSAERAASAAPSEALATGDLAAVFEHGVDAVSICTPPWAHAEMAIEALERGVHVLCEKPMAMNSSDARAMADAAAANGRLLCVSHNFLWSSAMQRARRALTAAGPISFVTATQLSSDERRLPTWADALPGGLLFDEVPHMLYVVEDLVGGPLRVVDVRTVWGGRESEPQSCEVRLEGERAVAQITMVFGTPISEWHVTSIAEQSVVDVDLFRDVMVSSGTDGSHRAAEVLATSARTAAHHFAGFAASGVRRALGRQFWGHDALIAEFVDAVTAAMAGEPCASPVPVERALSVMACLDDIVEAIGHD